MRVNAVKQGGRGERLDHDARRSQFRAALFDSRVRSAGQKDNGNARPRAIDFQLLQRLKPAHLRHFDIQQY